MLEITRLKIKTFFLSKQRKPKVFVNPYATQRPVVNEKLNPYVTDYGTKKTRTVQEMIYEKFKKTKPVEEEVKEIIQPIIIIKEPTFFDDMKAIFVGDLMWIARRKQNEIAAEEFSLYESDTS